MSIDRFPYHRTAYLVGGPADGQEREVSVSSASIYFAEPLPVKASFTGGASLAAYPYPSYRTHEYRQCPETGEWLWQGAK